MRNKDISFFFLSQLILPPVVLALPFLVLYKELALLDTRDRPHPALHADGAADRHLDHARPVRHASRSSSSEAALVDGLSVWGAFFRIVLPIALPGMVAAFILSLILCWNEYFFAALLTGTNAKTLPVMVASQTGSQGISWWAMAALATVGDRTAGGDRHRARALHHQGPDRGRRQIDKKQETERMGLSVSALSASSFWMKGRLGSRVWMSAR